MSETSTPSVGCNKNVALRLAQAGIYIFPCHSDPNDRANFKSPIMDLAPHWSRDSSTNSAVIEQWWEKCPHAMPGIDLGRSGLLVLDGDQPKKPEEPNGVDELDRILREHGNPETFEVSTHRHGLHVYFRQNGQKIGNPAHLKGPHNIDVKGVGGYVIAPGAAASDGQTYSATQDLAALFLAGAIPEVPADIAALLSPPKPEPRPPSSEPFGGVKSNDGSRSHYVEAAVANELQRVASAPSGTRTVTLFNAACNLGELVQAGDLRDGSVWNWLEDAAGRCGLIQDKGIRTVRAQIRNGLARVEGKPRDLSHVGRKDVRPIVPERSTPQTERAVPAAGAPPLILTAGQFVQGFTPPDYVIDGMVQRGYLYSLTARTGHGKTAVSLYLTQAVARGESVRNREVKQGSVLILAGENPDDIRARFLVLSDSFQFDPESVPVHFIPGVVSIAEAMPRIAAEAAQIPDLVLVIVDTAAAYFQGDDNNSNAQQGEYARLLRQLTFLPGKPAVVVNCHPVKNASRENLIPLGGGAFLNEVDGNLTLWNDGEKQATLHWQGKFRGPEFEPLAFRLETAISNVVRDSKGRHMPSIIARTMSEAEQEAGEAARTADENVLLGVVGMNPGASVAELAKKANWLTREGEPHKSKVFRLCMRMRDDKLLENVRGKWRLTAKGKREIGWSDEDE